MMKDLPVRLIVESQVLLQKYKEARGEMHFLYKIVRADSDVTLYKQFAVGTSAILKQQHQKQKLQEKKEELDFFTLCDPVYLMLLVVHFSNFDLYFSFCLCFSVLI